MCSVLIKSEKHKYKQTWDVHKRLLNMKKSICFQDIHEELKVSNYSVHYFLAELNVETIPLDINL